MEIASSKRVCPSFIAGKVSQAVTDDLKAPLYRLSIVSRQEQFFAPGDYGLMKERLWKILCKLYRSKVGTFRNCLAFVCEHSPAVAAIWLWRGLDEPFPLDPIPNTSEVCRHLIPLPARISVVDDNVTHGTRYKASVLTLVVSQLQQNWRKLFGRHT